ncbi:putative membrane protein [Azorhizobium caulinodans ORS 571]|uniref:Putative membrane protein n=1 Tax=Azorhizobium caulinodans (strain ATCC 43989 / DSM 5975 / JCM 20966 / LMG 6465 / NBRC 14845 / NCIMB 13405 / ORS 571) TaxID=438753 RepID=A8HR91_AZOC5|nr:GtrA family protein [Azorhizobium caulinodans]BAF87142.1 putative membrane protein [Azorhizobium caulinodans ORS 571]
MFALLTRLAQRHRAFFLQFATFVGVGLTAAAGHFTTLAIMVERNWAGPVLASLAGFIVGSVISYSLNRRFTFESTRSHAGALPRFATVAGIAFIMTGVLMDLLVHRIGLYYLLAQAITTGLVMIWTFSAYRIWAFAHKAGAREQRAE